MLCCHMKNWLITVHITFILIVVYYCTLQFDVLPVQKFRKWTPILSRVVLVCFTISSNTIDSHNKRTMLKVNSTWIENETRQLQYTYILVTHQWRSCRRARRCLAPELQSSGGPRNLTNKLLIRFIESKNHIEKLLYNSVQFNYD